MQTDLFSKITNEKKKVDQEKLGLILYSPLENSTTRITIVIIKRTIIKFLARVQQLWILFAHFLHFLSHVVTYFLLKEGREYMETNYHRSKQSGNN